MHAIVHVDGDAFFASCEIAQNERLRGKPVVTGQEKGMAIAVSYEAKARGVSRGMLMGDIKKICPDVIILSGNYDLYKIYSHRMYKIVARYAERVEEYSVDECFSIVTGDSWNELLEKAQNIKHALEQDLGMTFSLGLGPTKTLAKVASKWEKPAGFTAMQHDDIFTFLEKVPIGAVWGIGRKMSLDFQKKNITTALQFAQKSEIWVKEHFNKPYQELWYELNGIAIHGVVPGQHEKHKSIRATRTFKPPSHDKNFIYSQLSKNAEKACAKLRHYNLQFTSLYFYLKTQAFTYSGKEIVFPASTSVPADIMNAIEKEFFHVFKKNVEYRATGIVLHSITDASVHQTDLFNMQKITTSKKDLYADIIDKYFYKWGRSALFIASSLKARNHDRAHHKAHPDDSIYELCLKLALPYWGEAL